MNKHCILYYFLLLSVYSQAQVQELRIAGISRGGNLYIQNPYNNEKKSFCIQSVSLNDSTLISAPNYSALTIDLPSYSLNDSIVLIISHYLGCLPKVLNPRVLQSESSFKITHTSVDNASVSWMATGEQDSKAYYELERKYLEGWKKLVKIEAKGDIYINQYSVGVVHYSGESQFRLQYTSNSLSTYSDEFYFYSPADPISFYPTDEVDDVINLSEPTNYQIKDTSGTLYKEGFGLDIFVQSLPPGEYILIIENREELFYKPPPKDY